MLEWLGKFCLTKFLLNTSHLREHPDIQPSWKEPCLHIRYTHQKMFFQRFLVDTASFGDVMRSEFEPSINIVDIIWLCDTYLFLLAHTTVMRSCSLVFFRDIKWHLMVLTFYVTRIISSPAYVEVDASTIFSSKVKLFLHNFCVLE